MKFTAEDVIRHELVARIVAAYEGLPQKPATSKILTQHTPAAGLLQRGLRPRQKFGTDADLLLFP